MVKGYKKQHEVSQPLIVGYIIEYKYDIYDITNNFGCFHFTLFNLK